MKKKQKSNVVTIDNKEYDAEKLTNKAKFCLNAISTNQTKKQQLEIEMNNVDICLDYYVKELKKEISDL